MVNIIYVVIWLYGIVVVGEDIMNVLMLPVGEAIGGIR